MNRRLGSLVCLGAALSLPLLGGCALFHSSVVPPAPRVSGQQMQVQSWRDQIQRDPQGGAPTFGPLVEAQQAVAAAKSQPQVDNDDSQSLSQAEQSLTTAQQDWQAIANKKTRSDSELAQVASASHNALRLAQIARYTAMRQTGLDQLHQLQSQQANTLASSGQGTGSPESTGASAIDDQQLLNKRVVPGPLGRLQFQEGTARLTEDSHAVISRLADLLQQHPKLGVGIFGFTSNTTPPEDRLNAFVRANPKLAKQNPSHAEKVAAYLQGLSDARARDVAELLVQAGVNPDRIGARGLSDQHPAASNKTAAGRAKNNRDEVIMIPLSALGSGQ